MELTNEFTVAVPVDRAWAVLTDVETIAPCLPGAQLKEIEGDEYRGTVKVKVGPITAQYKGAAHFVERDEAAGRVVLRAEGRDTRGQGNASALITAQLAPSGEQATTVTVTTDLTVTGKVAQFGRGVMADVSGNLMGQFADNLATTVLGPTTGPSEASSAEVAPAESPAEEPAAPEPVMAPAAKPEAEAKPVPEATSETTAEPDAAPRIRVIDQPEAEPVDLMAAAGSPVLKRLLPAVAAVLAVFLIWRLWRRRPRLNRRQRVLLSTGAFAWRQYRRRH